MVKLRKFHCNDRFSAVRGDSSSLSRVERELVAVAVSAENECRY